VQKCSETKVYVVSKLQEKDLSFFRSSKFHLYMGVFWGIMLIPTILWLGQLVMYVSLISVWALISTEWGAYQASRAEEMQMSDIPTTAVMSIETKEGPKYDASLTHDSE
jgi:hypothetical protein